MADVALWSLNAVDQAPLPHIVRAEQWHYVDATGATYIDAVSGHWSVVLGHGIESIANAVLEQLRTLDFVPLVRGTHPAAMELSERLADLAPGDLRHVFFGTSGTEAVESALKFTRLYFHRTGSPQRSKVIYLDGAYHGSSLGSLSASGDDNDHRLFGPLLPGFVRAPIPARSAGQEHLVDAIAEIVEREGPARVAAVLFEPVIGSGGVLIPPDGWLRALRELCDRYGILLIADEVSTGYGRTGPFFAVEREQIVPDILIAGKAITNAYFPLSATIVRPHVYDVCTAGGTLRIAHDYTCGGHPAGCAAALEVLRLFEDEDVFARAHAASAHLLTRLKSVCELPCVEEVRGLGLMVALQLRPEEFHQRYRERDTDELLREAFLDHGLLCSLRDSVLKLLPAFTIPLSYIDTIVDTISYVLDGAVRGSL